MPSINEVKRLIKRVILSNLATNKKDLYLTPLISGKHGIGKSKMIKSIASELGGICMTIEGGALKEGEITGIPYQCKDDSGKIYFRFLPYYVIDKIQELEKKFFGNIDENNLFYDKNDVSINKKIDLIKNKKIIPVIIFLDEINRTDSNVYKEIMNILLTRNVNGYQIPWWVFFVAAMNPSNDYSSYQTNEMDPAQLDRFFKINVKEDVREWSNYAKQTDIDKSIHDFIVNNSEALSEDDKSLEDDEESTPSPRGWDMVDTILKGRTVINSFFTKEELRYVDSDIRILFEAKLGKKVTKAYYSFLSHNYIYILQDFLKDDENLSKLKSVQNKMTNASYGILVNQIIKHLKETIIDISQDVKEYSLMLTKLRALLELLDNSTAILFIQNAISTQLSNGEYLYIMLIDIFDEDMLNKLNLTAESIESLRHK